MKKKKPVLTIAFLTVLFILFMWMVWSAFLSELIPHHRTYYSDYDSFSKGKENFFLPKTLPDRAGEVEYYYGVRTFVSCAGYGMSLQEDEYASFLDTAKGRYRKAYDELPEMKDKDLYIAGESGEDRVFDEAFITQKDMGEIKELLGGDGRDITDYRIVAIYEYCGGPINSFSILVADDKTRRIAEISYIDRREK